MGSNITPSKIIAERQIPYRPRYTELTGRVTASILLQQMIYYWYNCSGEKPFYKFRAPCEHDRYVEDDSWTECLGFSPAEFDTALKTIGTKITKGDSITETLEKKDITSLVIYWTDSNRMTWYKLNTPLLDELLNGLYQANSRKCNYHEDEDSATSIELQNPELHSSQIPQITHNIPPPAEAEEPRPVKADVNKLLKSTMTKGEDETDRSPLAEYIGQQLNSPVPQGKCADLARGYTEHLAGGKTLKHPSPDELWLTHPKFPEWVDMRIAYFKGQGGSNAAKRNKVVNAICQYRGNRFAWLEWVAEQAASQPQFHDIPPLPDEEDAKPGYIPNWEELCKQKNDMLMGRA